MHRVRQRPSKSIILLVSLTSLSFFITPIITLSSSSSSTTTTRRRRTKQRLLKRQRKRIIKKSRNDDSRRTIIDNNNNNNKNNKIPKRVDVVIIGAGLAGLSAAAHLSTLDPPVSFVILEANDYIGGRVKTSYLDNDDGTTTATTTTPVDLGASHIDGHKYDLFFPDVTIPDVPDFNATFDVLRRVQELCDDDDDDGDGGGGLITSIATMDDNGKRVAYKLWDMYDEERGRMLSSKEKRRLLDDLWYDGYLAYEEEVRSNLTEKNEVNSNTTTNTTIIDDIDMGTIMTKYKQNHNLSLFDERFIDTINDADNYRDGGGDSLEENTSKGSGRYSNPYKFITKPFSNHHLPWVAYDSDEDDDDMTAVWDYGEVEYLQGNFGNLAVMFANCPEVSGGGGGGGGDLSESVYLDTTVTKVSHSKTKGAKIVYNTRTTSSAAAGSGSRGGDVTMMKKGKIKAQVVLVTASLGALRMTPEEGGIEFKPELPSELRDVIDNAGFGIIEKWIGYWDEDANLPWKNRTVRWSSLIPNPTNNTNTSSHNFNLFYNAHDVHNQKNIMIGLIFGDDALTMTNPTNSDHTIHQNAMTALRNIYGTAAAVVVPEPNDYKITRWSQNPTIRGSMAFTAANRHPTHDYATWSESINNSLLFAGDAVSRSFRSVGTTHAAWQSGWEAADFIDKMLFRKRVVCSLIERKRKCKKKFCRWVKSEKVCVQGR